MSETNSAISWRRMLMAIPRRNAAAEVERQPDGTVRIAVALRKPWWLVPPVSWMMKTANRRIVHLDAIGTQVWEWCDGRQTVEAIIDRFAREYAFSFHEARMAVTGYLRSLVQRGVLAIEQGTE